MKFTFRNFLLGVLLILLFSTCKHKCEKDPDSVFCPGCKQDQSLDGMKDYFFFKTGTWWVYQEQNSGALDTVTVFYDFEGLSNGFAYFEWRDTSTFSNYYFIHIFDDSQTIHCLTDKDCNCRKLSREKGRWGDYIGGGRYFTYPLFEGNYTNFDAVCLVEEFYETYNVLGFNFSSVAQIDLPDDKSTSNIGQHTKYWWAKNIGIVAFENVDLGTSWKLLNYTIIQ